MNQGSDSVRPYKRRRIQQNETPPSSPESLPSPVSGTFNFPTGAYDSAVQASKDYCVLDCLLSYQEEKDEAPKLNNVCFGMVTRLQHPQLLLYAHWGILDSRCSCSHYTS